VLAHAINYQDAMAICRVYGPPDLFVAFTCNTKWREIADALQYEPAQQPRDRSDSIVRVFNMKVDEFIDDIKEGGMFGAVHAVLYTIEFQKRGLPHIHCHVWLADGGSEFSHSTIDVGAMRTTMRQGESSMRAITIILLADTPQSTRNNAHDQVPSIP